MKALFLLSLLAIVLLVPAARAEEGKTTRPPARSEIPEEAKWKLEDLYPTRDAFEADLKLLGEEAKKVSACRGKLGKSLAGLAGCLEGRFSALKRLYRLYAYAMRTHDQDARDTAGQELKDRLQKAATEFDAQLSFFEPEILKIPAQKLKTWVRAKRLSQFGMYLDNISRRRKHILSPAEEKLLAESGEMAAVPEDVYRSLTTVNLPYPEVQLSDGRKVKLTPAMYTLYRALDKRDDRLRVFQAFWGAHKDFRESLAATLSGRIKGNRFYARARRYGSDLEAALDATNVPQKIYTNMIAEIKKARPLLWRHLDLRRRMLEIPELGYHDLYASIVPAMEMKVSYEQARALLPEALAPLGADYAAALKKAFEERWTDVYPTEGKRSGAYSEGGAYDVHPYVLLNYNNDYDSLSTLAHEFGHALHSYFSNARQPFPLADYPIFVAEVASTCNENLLRLHLLKSEADKNRRLFLLGQHLENFRTTVFRQALFAEFEMLIHKLSADGEPLTADRLDTEYLKLLKEYYGEAEGHIKIDPLYAVEWAYIPHFYYNFYMFQYTTSFIAATSIAEKIFGGDAATRDKYLKMLSAGGSAYPVELLKIAGVDMTAADPYQVAFESMKRTLDEIEKLISE